MCTTFCEGSHWERLLTLGLTECPDDPALGKTLKTDFTQGESSDWEEVKGPVAYGKDGVELTIHKRGQSPTIQTSKYFFFGTVEVVMKTSPGTGIISSIVMMSDDLDEIDWVRRRSLLPPLCFQAGRNGHGR